MNARGAAFVLTLFFLAAIPSSLWAASAVASGYWTNGGTWGGTPPPLNDSVTIGGGYTVTADVATVSLNALTVDSTLVFSGWNSGITSATVTINGTVRHLAQSATTTNASGQWIPDNRVHFVCTNLIVNAGGTINADYRGYAGVTNGANGCGPGGGRGQAQSGGGGSYGGVGSGIPGRGQGGPVYGATNNPIDPGSAGGSKNNSTLFSGNGGGAIRIEAANGVTVNGIITAIGQDGAGGNDVGGGSGGGIAVSCQAFSGTGQIRANGGASQYGGAGGGGRIAVNHGGTVTWTGVIQARGMLGGGGGGWAQSGTLHIPSTAVLPQTVTNQYFRIYGVNAWSPASLTLRDSVIGLEEYGFQASVATNLFMQNSSIALGVEGLTNYVALSVGGDLTMTNGSGLWIYSGVTNPASVDYGALLSVGRDMEVGTGCVVYVSSHPTNGGSVLAQCRNLSVRTNGLITADATGFAGGANRNGWGPGGGIMSGSSGGGGGYGGHGGQFDTRGMGGPTYGASNAPTLPGSGGGGKSGSATVPGRGGGLIRIVSEGNVTVNGTMTANGQDYMSNDYGAGSGGAIYILCRRIMGSGLLLAKGGNVNSYAGAGGGGRIAVWRLYDEWTGSVSVTNGSGATQNGIEIGTVFWGQSRPGGTVFVIH